MRIIRTAALIFLFLPCLIYGQKPNIINDLKFANIKGNPKKITETIFFGTVKKASLKKIFYYGDDGFLTKIEEYKVHYSQYPDSLFLGEISIYNNKNKLKRTYKKTDCITHKTLTEGVIEKVSDTVYKSTSVSKSINSSLGRVYLFDKNEQLISTQYGGNLFASPIKKIITYNYNNGKLEYIYVEDKIKGKEYKELYLNLKYDNKQNVIYEENFNEAKTLLNEKIIRFFEY
jgi:hypothetical protein